jgi:hypothetical protein
MRRAPLGRNSGLAPEHECFESPSEARHQGCRTVFLLARYPVQVESTLQGLQIGTVHATRAPALIPTIRVTAVQYSRHACWSRSGGGGITTDFQVIGWPVFNPRTPKRARCGIELATLVHMRREIMALAVPTGCVAAAALIEFF